MKTNKPLGLYIHIPFCVRKCRYCDFASVALSDADAHRAYINKLVFEIVSKRQELRDYEVNTIYLGGGTPSLLAPALMDEIFDAIYANLNVRGGAEITIEANPGTVSKEAFSSYKAAGINRISLGAQSFDERVLRFLGRIHSVNDIKVGAEQARSAGFENISLDLIFGIPGQGIESWQKNLKEAALLAPKHISFYSLQVEEGTPLAEDMATGRIPMPDEDLDREMYHFALDFLREKGFVHYELSNAAKTGFESRHNLKYWSMDEYMGFGAAAHSFMGGRRFANHTDLGAYMAANSAEEFLETSHMNTERESMSEYVFLGLRKIPGISLSDFRRVFGREFAEVFGEQTEGLIAQGLVERAGDTLRLTSRGFDFANAVFRAYV